MYFSVNLSEYSYILIGVAALCTIILLWWFVRRMAIVANNNTEKISDEEPLSASVIVYSNDDTENLAQLLPILIEQDYPKFEIIVVDDSCSDSTKDMLMELSLKNDNLYYTYIPDGTLNLSRKKLALTLGIKAAKNDVIVTTVSNCKPNSDKWLRRIMNNFDHATDVVIGYSYPNTSEEEGSKKYYRAFDHVISSVQYLSYALRGKPYRGDGNNLAYRKSVFFEHKGFSRSLNLHYGDDDLFVNEIANGYNTCVELSDDSQMMVKYSDPAYDYRERKLHYGFTSRYINTFAKTSSSIVSIVRYLLIIVIAAFIWESWFNLFTIALSVALILGIWTCEIIVYRKCARKLNSRRLLFLLPFFLLWRPVSNWKYKMINRKYRKLNYTWQRRKRKWS